VNAAKVESPLGSFSECSTRVSSGEAPRKIVQRSKEDRNAQIYARRKDGLTLAAIGREFHVSLETVHRVVKQMKLKDWWNDIDKGARRERLARLVQRN
jgi:hypothetical protein